MGGTFVSFDVPAAGISVPGRLTYTGPNFAQIVEHDDTRASAYSERCRSPFRRDGDRDSELMPIAIPR
jgi:hypothetical protein